CADVNNWDSAPIALAPAPSDDPDLDLALDTQGSPHLSYSTGSPSFGLGYARCTANCASAGASWQSELLEASTVLNSEWARPPFPGCTFSSWYGGYRSTLKRTGAGEALVAYDAEHLINSSNACVSVTTDYKTVRILVPAGS